ncbi:TPA: hypothetical protein DIV48_03140 [Candidatus Kaiserbacteria bacterium]|nr:MAG: hypothetical protein UY93_C0003G0104 [Parcubacteria group bacterium GW2011_GWA1_56_13]KKW46921.1 MAG: hypothetical protein UY97_C0002G0032 [Parcubacteria group bacterium GW2011_GWB1_57_6]HCR52609.1 hypothetical protein [Candidatus Kaiserbacteria bacterium]
MKSISIISIVLVILLGLFLWGYGGSKGTTASVQGVTQTPASASELTAAETLYDFGTISMKDGNVTKDFTVENTTSKDIVLSTVVTSCMCTTAYVVGPDEKTKGPFGMPGMGYTPPVNEVMKSGETRTVRVVYDPNAHGPAGVGRIDRFVTITDATGGTLELEVKALVTP